MEGCVKEFNAKVGKRVRDLRKRHGHTQEDLAKALGTEARSVSRKEAGANAWPIYELMMVANLYKVPIGSLLPGYNDKSEASDLSRLDPDEQRLIRSYRLLSELDRRDLIATAMDFVLKTEEESKRLE
jgi:transcriptional regulator with XRE-family HTH domain